MNWIEKASEELEELIEGGLVEDALSFFRDKLRESYKNGAQAERRKASKEKPEASENR